MPLRELESPALLRALAARGVELRAAVTPEDLRSIPRLVRACAAEGARVGFWPLLDDARGRWGSCENAEAFAEHVGEVEAAARAEGAEGGAFVLDLEPPIGAARAIAAGRISGFFAGGGPWLPGAETLAGLARALRARGGRVEVAAIPAVVADGLAPGWERALGTPVGSLACDHVSAMLYTSLFEGYSRGFLRRRDARRLLYALGRAARRRYGSRAGVSLGVVGGGALGDEPRYRSPDELADDVAIARAAGVDALGLYSLDGALARPPVEVWLEAFAASSAGRGAGPPPPAVRARATLAALSLASPPLWVLSRREWLMGLVARGARGAVR